MENNRPATSACRCLAWPCSCACHRPPSFRARVHLFIAGLLPFWLIKLICLKPKKNSSD